MKAILITIGDEILYGQTVDTNSAWMGDQLTQIGVKVHEIISISDEKIHILGALQRATDQADIVLITGGLGPTNDDITKATLAEYFNVELEMNEIILKALEGFFTKRGMPMLENNRQQAALPTNCTALRNEKGTAWGMWFEENETVYVSMPGVPFEMKAIMADEVLPKLCQQFELPVIVHKHVLTAAIPESFLAEKLEKFEAELPKEIKLAYLPSAGKVKLRLTATSGNRKLLLELLDQQVGKLKVVAGKYIYGYDNDPFEGAIGKLLKKHQKTIATAESCTGGYIAHLLTSVAGSSAYFKGAIVSYANEVKHSVLGVSTEILAKHGAVSEETVKQMALGAIETLNTDYAIATSGIAGPSGGTEEKPVGTVWIAVGSKDNIRVKQYNFPGSREQNIKWTAVVALENMRKYLKESLSED